ncbi:MAG: hypothetical protein M3Q83_00920 [Pseudomonadota bacterium]|nr:hypothetical protein [Pseudomonadota bacterium]
MPTEDQIGSFIQTSFRSIWALELLLHLRRNDEREWTPDELVTALRASDAIVVQSIESLVAAGLLVTASDGSVRYAPATPELGDLVTATASYYDSSPGAVRRLIIGSAHGGLTAFADAFRLRKD